MSPILFGASQREWEAFGTLCLEDLLPTVCDPSIKPNERSQLKELMRAPSVSMGDGTGKGIARWPDHVTTSTHDWQTDPAHGICIICRRIRAIDIDITDEMQAHYAQAIVNATLGVILPERTRSNSSKRLLTYRLADPPGRMKKTIVNTPYGNVEFLHERQQFIAAGMHWSGAARYAWPNGIPRTLDDIPLITLDQLIAVHRALSDAFNPGQSWVFSTEGLVPLPRSLDQVDYQGDPIVRYLAENDWIKGYRDDGSIAVRSPWAADYSTPDRDDSAVFYPAGLGGHNEPGFKGLHASDGDKTATDFLEAIGYRTHEIVSEFEVVEFEVGQDDEDDERPELSFTKGGKLEPILSNIVGLLGWRSRLGYEIHYDSFKDALLIRPYPNGKWTAVNDNTFTMLRLRLADMGLPAVSKENVRDAIYLLAERNTIDSAQAWLKSLKWDGVPRIKQFHQRVLKVEDTEYHQAVCEYLWTALAGRVLQPGVKADMVPIFSGKQGLRKSSLIGAIAPSVDEFTTINMKHDDADLGRQLRGRLVAEWDELRGLNTRDVDMLKGWVSRTHDEWTPKFKEFAHKQARRFIVCGTVNGNKFLNDPTGLRRWLPMYVTSVLDVDYVITNRNQLWAEARMLFEKHGVLWQRAEALAPEAHRKATVVDIWTHDIRRWLHARPTQDGWDTAFILTNAIGMPAAQASRISQERVRQVMTYLGWEEDDDGRWYSIFA